MKTQRKTQVQDCICVFPVVMIIKICVQIKKEKIYAARNYKRIGTDH